MAESKFDFSAYMKWVQKLAIADKELIGWLKQFLLEQAQLVVRAAKERTPVDTGALINSYVIGGQEIALKHFVDKKGKEHFDLDTENSQVADISLVGNDLVVTIWNPMEYASYIEYGTEKIQPYRMLTVATDDVRRVLPQRFKKQFEEYLKSKGVV